MKPATVLVIPDTHVTFPGSPEGGIDPAAESVLFQAIPIIKPTWTVHIGDVGEWQSVSPWQWKRRKRPPDEFILPFIHKEAKAINQWLDKLQAALSEVGCDRLTITEGNHEVWANNFAEEQFRPEYTAHKLMQIDARGIEWHEHGEYANIGKLHVTHGGHFTDLHHAYKTVLGLSASCMYGHFHNVESAHVMHLGGAYGAWCIGTLCKLKKKFLGGKPTSWSHAFAIVHLETNGTFHVEVVDIFKGTAYVYGKRVSAK